MLYLDFGIHVLYDLCMSSKTINISLPEDLLKKKSTKLPRLNILAAVILFVTLLFVG